MVRSKKIFRRREVGVEDGDELPFRRLHPLRQRASLVALAICPVVVADGIAQRSVALDQAARHGVGFVGGIVEHLNVEFLARIIQLADRLQQAFDDILLIEDRQLHRDQRQIFKMRGGFGGVVLAVLVIEIDEDVAVHAIPRQQNEHNEIRNQQREIESVRLVEPAKCCVQKMLADVGPNAFGGSP